MTTPEPSARVVVRAELDRLIADLRARGYEVIGPRLRDGAIVQGAIESTADLPVGWRDIQEPGKYRLERRGDEALFGFAVGPEGYRPFFQVPHERLVSLRRKGASFEAAASDPGARRLALFGARGCDLAAIGTQDLVFRQGAFVDPRYAARRADVIVVAVSCNDPAATCFCVSMGTGPTPHDRGAIQPRAPSFDLAISEIFEGGHRFLVEVGSEIGADLLAARDSRPAEPADHDQARALAKRAREAMVRRIDNRGIKELLYQAAEHPRFDDVAARCLTCTNCTLVCPTCFCSRIDDSVSLDGQTAERSASWDSCFSLEHSHMHGGSARSSVKSRYRHWLTHKLASWFDQFGVSGCVGCGRCIAWCPAGIDITEEVAAIRQSPERKGDV